MPEESFSFSDFKPNPQGAGTKSPGAWKSLVSAGLISSRQKIDFKFGWKRLKAP